MSFRIEQNLIATLSLRAKEAPTRVALHIPDHYRRTPNYQQVTYAELEQRVAYTKGKLAKLGLAPQQRVVLMVSPSLDFFVLSFAIFASGASVVFVDPGMGLKKLKACLAEANATYFVGNLKANFARRVFGWAPGAKSLLSLRNRLLPSRKNEHFDSAKQPKIDEAAILYTSGSTGSPKGAIYTHENFLAQIALLREGLQFRDGEKELCTFPLFMLFAPALGLEMVLPRMDFTRPGSVDPEEILRPLEDFGIWGCFGSPALWRRLLSSRNSQFKERLKNLRRIVTAGAPLPYQLIQELRNFVANDCEILTPYGATEALPIAVAKSQDILRSGWKKGIYLGKPVTNLRIAPLGEEAFGEILVEGAQVSKTYVSNSATKAHKVVDSEQLWHRTGDLGYLDDNGDLWFYGRKAETFCNSGKTWLPAKIEAVYNAHPQVERAALIQFKNAPAICLEGCKNLELIESLKTWGRQNLPDYPIETFLFVKKFPVDIRHNSKIHRLQLTRMMEQQAS